MATYLRPDVYIEEVAQNKRAVMGVSTAITGFMGVTKRGPIGKPIFVTSYSQFERIFGGHIAGRALAYSIDGFFKNGGTGAWVNRLAMVTGDADTYVGNTAQGTVADVASTVGGAFKLFAGYRGYQSPGIDGNLLYYTIEDNGAFNSQGDDKDLTGNEAAGQTRIGLSSIKGLQVGSLIKLDDSVGSTPEYHEVTAVNTDITAVSGAVVFSVDIKTALASPFPKLTTTVTSLEKRLKIYHTEIVTPVEIWDRVSFNADADNFIGTALNDSETGSIYVTIEDLGVALGNVTGARILPNSAANAAILIGSTAGTNEIASLSSKAISGNPTAKTGVYAFDEIQDLNLICCPPAQDTSLTEKIEADSITGNVLLTYAGNRMDCFAVLDTPPGLTAATALTYRDETLGSDSYWGALYYPHLEVPDSLGKGNKPTAFIPPSGHICGIMSRVDNLPAPSGGVSAAPAGIGEFGKVKNCVGLATYISDQEQDTLNPAGINCIRNFTRGGLSAPGIIVFGARTLSSQPSFRYLQVRRLMTFVEQSVRMGSRWAVFRNNDYRLWNSLTMSISSFLRRLHSQGMLSGETESEAFFVKIDGTTTTPTQVEQGLLIGEIGISPVRPAEFIVFKFSQFQAGSEITE